MSPFPFQFPSPLRWGDHTPRGPNHFGSGETNMRLLKVQLWMLMIAIASLALLLVIIFRSDFPSLPVGRIWVGECAPYWWGEKHLPAPRLAAWVLPALTVAVIWPSRNTLVFGAGSAAAGIVLLSWIVLRRPLPVLPGGLFWPDYHLNYLGRLCSLRGVPSPSHLVWPRFMPASTLGWADLLSLLTVLAVVSVRFFVTIPPRLLAAVALAVNSHPCIEWFWSMWVVRDR